MDKLLSVHQNRATKHTKTKKRPVKVVYISNPMKVETSASEFRALVQELTGRHAVMPEYYSGRYGDADKGTVGGLQILEAGDHGIKKFSTILDHEILLPKRSEDFSGIASEPYDDDLMSHEMLENFAGLLPSSYLYESPHVDVLRNLDAV